MGKANGIIWSKIGEGIEQAIKCCMRYGKQEWYVAKLTNTIEAGESSIEIYFNNHVHH
jgi:hypothetical protein